MFKFTVSRDGHEPFDAIATSRDLAKWESTGKGRSLGTFGDNPRMVDMYQIAFITCERLDLFDGDIRAFREECDLEFEKLDADDETGPTRPVR